MKLHKILLPCLLVAVIALVGVFTLPTKAEAATEGDYFYTVSKGEATITDVKSPFTGPITIPSTLGGYPVTTIGKRAFENRINITTVTFPETITSIEDAAFYNCTGLTKVYAPSLEFWCSIDFGSYASNPMCYAQTLYFDGVPLAGDIVIPEGTTELTGIFQNCTGLTSVVIPDTVTSINSSAFDNCSGLTSITIPDSVTTIGSSAFSRCSGLTNVILGSGLTNIGEAAFRSCKNLTSIQIPDSVKTIGARAFIGCNSLVSVTVPEGVTSIGYEAFGSCDNLFGIWVDENNTKYSSDDRGVLFDKAKTTLIQAPGGIQGSYTIPDSVSVIQYYSFKYCEQLNYVTIPDNVTQIGQEAFAYCTGLVSVTIGTGLTKIYKDTFSFSGVDAIYYAGSEEQWTDLGMGASSIHHFLHIHDYSLLTPVTTAPTCTQLGYTEYTCAYGDTYRETTPALGHKKGADAVVTAPTCTEKGYTTSTCARCGVSYESDNTYALGHDYTGAVEEVYGSCTQNGHSGPGCTRCDAVRVDKILTAPGHHIVAIPAKEPTCTEPGTTAGTQCDRCEAYFITPQEIPSLGHDYADPEETYYSSCTEGGHSGPGCTRCDSVRADKVLPPREHNVIHILPKDATCTENGNTAGSYCDYCSTCFMQAEIIPALQHSFTNYVSNNDATITEDGTKTAKCDRCEATDTVTDEGTRLAPAGDFDGDSMVTDSDALYLLRHTLFEDRYPILGNGDVDSDGSVTDADALYLLRHTLFADRYPLYPGKEEI